MSNGSRRPTVGAHLPSADVNFLDLDLNLLIALDALLGEQSVTRAAEVLQRSQPALSASLKRLRYQFQDDLLVRVGNHYELTPLATQLRQRVAMVMADVERLFATRARFDAEASTRQFVIHTADYGQQMLGRAIATELARASAEYPVALPSALRRSSSPGPPMRCATSTASCCHSVSSRTFRTCVAYHDRWVLLVDRNNDRVGETVTLDELAELEWVSAFHRQGSHVPAVRQLQLLGVDLHVVVAVEGFASLPWFRQGHQADHDDPGAVGRTGSRPPRSSACWSVPFEVVPLTEAFWWHRRWSTTRATSGSARSWSALARRIEAELPSPA